MEYRPETIQEMIEASADRLESLLDRPAHLREIASDLGLSQRTLRAHFQKLVGISPIRYLWLKRMVMARRELCEPASPGTTVTNIALRYHFSELGRFSVSYRRLFGECPSATLRRCRNESWNLGADPSPDNDMDPIIAAMAAIRTSRICALTFAHRSAC